MLVDFSSYEFSQSKGFVVLEGLNGAGKTTLLKKIESYLSSKDIAYRTTFEPGGSPIGRQIRQILLDQTQYKLGPIGELLFFCAERAEHVSKVIKPALDMKKVVLCDRFFYSTLAFQGYGRGIDLEQTNSACQIAIQGTAPDLVILLDIEVQEALTRIHKRDSDDVDDFEKEEVDFHERLKDGFLKIAEFASEPFLVADANKSADAVWLQVQPVLDRWADSLSRD